MAGMKSSPRPKARPSTTVKSSPRPKARPTSTAKRSGGGVFSGNTKGGNLSGNGGGRSTPNTGGNAQSNPKPKPRRPSVKPDNSLLLNRGSSRGLARSVMPNLSGTYLPGDVNRAVNTLQAFNGPRNPGRTKLGQ